jgi:hypothetical protein
MLNYWRFNEKPWLQGVYLHSEFLTDTTAKRQRATHWLLIDAPDYDCEPVAVDARLFGNAANALQAGQLVAVSRRLMPANGTTKAVFHAVIF